MGYETTSLRVRTLSDEDAVRFMSAVGLRFPQRVAASTVDEAVTAAQKVGFPVALKIDPTRFKHKSDVNGVALSVSGDDAVREEYLRLAAAAGAVAPDDPGVITVENMVPPGLELVLAVTTDESFGRTLMAGFGGVLVELLEDVAFRLLPITSADAFDMVASLRAQKLLAGYRGAAAIDVDALCDLIVRVADAVDNDGSIVEVEFNPIIATGDTFTAVDWAISCDT